MLMMTIAPPNPMLTGVMGAFVVLVVLKLSIVMALKPAQCWPKGSFVLDFGGIKFEISEIDPKCRRPKPRPRDQCILYNHPITEAKFINYLHDVDQVGHIDKVDEVDEVDQDLC